MLSQIKFVVLKLFYLSLDLEHIFHLLAVEVSFTSSCWMTIIKITSNELKFSFISTSICRDIHSILCSNLPIHSICRDVRSNHNTRIRGWLQPQLHAFGHLAILR